MRIGAFPWAIGFREKIFPSARRGAIWAFDYPDSITRYINSQFSNVGSFMPIPPSLEAQFG